MASNVAEQFEEVSKQRMKAEQNRELDLPEASLRHREIILGKPFLKKIYEEWYQGFIDATHTCPAGKFVEIGSGGGFLKDMFPQVVTSDILPLPVCDMAFSAEEMPFEANSLSGIFMLNVLHHIPHPGKFLAEAERVLKKGGMIYFVEPANTLMSRFIYKNFHHEPFIPESKSWEFESLGPLSDANGAIPWMIFSRDIEKFNKEFPKLRCEQVRVHTPFRYLMTGGLSKPSMVPASMFGAVTALEAIFTPFFPLLGLFQTIVVRKK